METKKTIDFSVIEYSQSTGPRYCTQGDDSGEDFYHTKLNPLFCQALKEDAILRITLDGADGYASSFLDVAFGNLVYDFSAKVVSESLVIISNDEDVWLSMIKEETIPEWEKRRIKNEQAKVTSVHNEWGRLVNGQVQKKVWIQ